IVQALQKKPLTIYGDGSQTRSFCYASDLIAGIIKLLLMPPSNDIGMPVNIGNPEERTVHDLADKILSLTGSSSRIERRELPIDDPKVRRPDITRARTLLDWSPKVDIDQGLQLTIEYFRKKVA